MLNSVMSEMYGGAKPKPKEAGVRNILCRLGIHSWPDEWRPISEYSQGQGLLDGKWTFTGFWFQECTRIGCMKCRAGWYGNQPPK